MKLVLQKLHTDLQKLPRLEYGPGFCRVSAPAAAAVPAAAEALLR